MKLLDTRGHLCPMPIIMLKQYLKENGQHGFKIFTDNEISKNNLLSFLQDNKYQIALEKVDDYWIIGVNVSDDGHDSTTPYSSNLEGNYNKKPTISLYGGQVFVINSNKMGEGNEELGEMLIKGFFNALTEMDNYPDKIIFYNSGALLCVDSSPIIKSLRKLIEQGVDVLICGACVDFYQLKEQISLGTITNMYTICEIFTKCEKVVYL